VRLPHSSESAWATQLLTRWKSGGQEALQALIPLVYKELRLAGMVGDPALTALHGDPRFNHLPAYANSRTFTAAK
jgi:hypothetical protein